MIELMEIQGKITPGDSVKCRHRSHDFVSKVRLAAIYE